MESRFQDDEETDQVCPSGEESRPDDELLARKWSPRDRSRLGQLSEEQYRCHRQKRSWRNASFLQSFRSRPSDGCAHGEAAEPGLEVPCRKSRRSGACRSLAVIITAILALFGLFNLIQLGIGLGPLIWDPEFHQSFPDWGQAGSSGQGLSDNPTALTRDVLPIPCHSHNDYWRKVPLYEAISYGFTSVEADVWLFDDEELYVGHTAASLNRNRTLTSLYLDPLLRLLHQRNPLTNSSHAPRNGIFEEDPNQTLVLLIDYKTDGAAIHPRLEAQLSTFRDQNYLTYFDGENVVPGPITVVGTGNAPFQLINANKTYRDVFFDAPLDKLADERWMPKTPLQSRSEGQGNTGVDPAQGASQFTSTNSYYASVNFGSTIGYPWRGHLSKDQMSKLRKQIRAAHEKGLKARYWSTPVWPVRLRNHVWSVLMQEGADYLNVDDLRAAAESDWRRKKNRDW